MSERIVLRDYEQDLARCDERTRAVAVALASGAEIEAKYYAAEAKAALAAADAYDAAHNVHRVVLDSATVERVSQATGWAEHVVRTVLAAAVKEWL